MEIAEGIDLISGVKGANVYLVKDDSKVTVVDTRLPGSTGKILDCIEKIGGQARGALCGLSHQA